MSQRDFRRHSPEHSHSPGEAVLFAMSAMFAVVFVAGMTWCVCRACSVRRAVRDAGTLHTHVPSSPPRTPYRSARPSNPLPYVPQMHLPTRLAAGNVFVLVNNPGGDCVLAVTRPRLEKKMCGPPQHTTPWEEA